MKLEVSGIEFSYGSTQILKSVCLEVDSSEILGILGPNGSGKTTLIKCINRILTPHQGAVALDQDDVLTMKQKDVAKHFGYVPQNSVNDLSCPTVFEVVMMGRRPYSMGWQYSKSDEDIVWESLEELGVTDLASRSFDRLSSGQSQRVLMARALCQGADVLLLDEPTSNLDIRYQIEVMSTVRRLVKEKGVSALAIIHDIDMAMRYCDKAVILSRGEIIAAGSAEDVITADNIRDAYGVDVVIDRNYGRPHVIVV